MAATSPWKKAPYMKEQIAQANPQKEASTSERMNDHLQLLSLNKITHYFKIWTAQSGVLKKIILPLQKSDALNRSY